MYKVALPSQLLSDMHVSLPGEDNDGRAFRDMEIPAKLLENLRPDLARDTASSSSESTGMELVGEETRSESSDSVIDLAMDAQCSDVEIIDLTGED